MSETTTPPRPRTRIPPRPKAAGVLTASTGTPGWTVIAQGQDFLFADDGILCAVQEYEDSAKAASPALFVFSLDGFYYHSRDGVAWTRIVAPWGTLRESQLAAASNWVELSAVIGGAGTAPSQWWLYASAVGPDFKRKADRVWRRYPTPPSETLPWQRNGGCLVEQGGRLHLFGGVLRWSGPDSPGVNRSDAWLKEPGRGWRQVATPDTIPFDAPDGPGGAYWRDRIWMVGGYKVWAGGVFSNEVWSSGDRGRTWEPAPTPPWAPRSNPVVLALNDQLYVTGGQSDVELDNTIWVTNDGRSWSPGPTVPHGMSMQNAIGCVAPDLVLDPRRAWFMSAEGWIATLEV